MTEKEKMQQQMLYDANYDTELIRERQVAKDLCYQFNQLRPSDETNQQQILSQLLGKKSDNCCILAPFWCDYGYNIEVGKNFFANHNTVILDGAKVTFGDNVWIGAGVHVMPGVKIGSNVVIGGGSVVVKDIPDNVVAVGNPCHPIRPITETDKHKSWDRFAHFKN